MDRREAIAVAVLAVGCFLLGMLLAIDASNEKWMNDAVNRGAAIYCPDNGQWAWIGECE